MGTNTSHSVTATARLCCCWPLVFGQTIPAACLQLAPGLSGATGLTALSIDNFRMSVDMVWEQLASLVPRSPFLKVKAAGHTLRGLALELALMHPRLLG